MRASETAWRNARVIALRRRLSQAQRWRVERTRALRLIEKFDPDEPRDPSGRWTDGGGDGGGDKPSGDGEKPPKNETVEQQVQRIVAQVPGAKEKLADARAKSNAMPDTNLPVGEGGFMQRNGFYNPARQLVHADILQKIFTPEKVDRAVPAKGEKPVLHLLGGAGGSGKGWFTKPGEGTVRTDNAIYLNTDDMKAMLPEYAGWNAPNLHEESSYLMKVAEKIALAQGLNIIIDGTMGKLKQLQDRVKNYKASGYRVEGHFMRVSPETAAKRALGRFVRGGETGRYVPPELLLAHAATQNFETAREKMDASEVYDNEGDAPKFVSRR
jgi:predicted ABC-type ATPase